MRVTITDEQFWQQLSGFERSAWRFEQQPKYHVGYERKQFDDFLAGHPEAPTENPELGAWMAQVARQTTEGKTVGRVRIVDDPITDYQRWMRWMDHWNREAGETIDYLSRRHACEVGLIPAVGEEDWWFFDNCRLMVMHYDDIGRTVRVELLDEEPEIVLARRWRDLAVRAAREENHAVI